MAGPPEPRPLNETVEQVFEALLKEYASLRHDSVDFDTSVDFAYVRAGEVAVAKWRKRFRSATNY